jgi:hypothetical protein
MHVRLYVKTLFTSVKLQLTFQFTFPDIKFHENPSVSRLYADRWTDTTKPIRSILRLFVTKETKS